MKILSMSLTKRRIFKWAGLAFGGTLLVGLVVLVFALADTIGFFRRPVAGLEQSPNSLIVHVETLGDYVTAVGHVRIQEATTGKVIYEAVAKDRVPCFLNFRFSVGENPTQVVDFEGNSYRITEPQGENTFTLQTGMKYKIRLWGDSWTYSEASFKF